MVVTRGTVTPTSEDESETEESDKMVKTRGKTATCKVAMEMEGSEHQVECTGPNCVAWVVVWLPKKISRKFLDRDFLCGFCAAEKVTDLQTKLRDLKAKTANPPSHENERQISNEPKPTFAAILKNIKSEEVQQAKKSMNLIISGTKPTDNDTALVSNICRELNVNESKDCKTKRIGRKNENGFQMLLVSCANEKFRKDLLASSKKLSQIEAFKCIYINPDLTKSEREEQFNLRQQLKKARANFPNKKYMIKHGKIAEINA